MLIPHYQKSFKKDSKKLSTLQKEKAKVVIDDLINANPLDKSLQDHLLIGNYKGYRECHIEPDLLLIYKIEDDILKLFRIGSHSNLYKN